MMPLTGDHLTQVPNPNPHPNPNPNMGRLFASGARLPSVLPSVLRRVSASVPSASTGWRRVSASVPSASRHGVRVGLWLWLTLTLTTLTLALALTLMRLGAARSA